MCRTVNFRVSSATTALTRSAKGLRSEAHLCEVVNGFGVEVHQLVDNQVVTVGMNNTQTWDVRTVLNRLPLYEHRAQRHKHFASDFRIPHVPAAQHAVVDELSALSRRERPENQNLSFRLLLHDGASSSNGPLATERKNAFQVRMSAHQVERSLARRVHVFSDAVAVPDEG